MSKEKIAKPKKEVRKITLGEALALFIVDIAVIAFTALNGVHLGMGMFFAATISIAYGMIALHFSWDELFDSAVQTIASVMFGLMFCLSVGFVSAAWIASGTIPFMLYWGLELLNPNIFLVVAFVVCALTSWLTGQAWTMIPSLGIAFMGVAMAIGVPLPMAAAAIVTGCFIGDGASPVCEVPTIATISSGYTDMMQTVKSMVPSLGVGIIGAAIIYLVMGFGIEVDAAQATAAAELQASVAGGFNLSVLTLLPLILVFILLLVVKLPALPSVLIGAVAGLIEAVLLQGANFVETLGMMWSGYVCNTGDAMLDALMTRGGFMDFAGSIVMMLFAFSFAGVIQKMGVLEVIMERVLRVVKRPGTLILCTSLTTILGCAVTGGANANSLLNGTMYKDAYKKMGLHPCNLARTMSMIGPFVCCALPWTSSGILVLESLGINNFEFWPFMFVSFITFALNIIYAYMGKFTKKLDPEDMDEQPALSEA